MTHDQTPSQISLLNDPLLQELPVVEGFKVLDPVVLLAKIGEGGMGAVYQGSHMSLDIEVALKCLRQDLAAQDQDFVDRFKREARIAASVNSPHLIRVFDVNQSHGLHYLIMEFVRGESARERVERKGPLGIEEAMIIARCAAMGLSTAHEQGIVHRDIKPENIMISGTGQVKVADLGLARAGDEMDNVKTQTGMLMGTPRYMPPEQYADAHRVGPEGDVYSLAATLYFLLAGENAVPSGSLVQVMHHVCNEDFPDIRAHRHDVPDDLAELILDATRKDPAERLASCCEMVERLDGILKSSDSKACLKDEASGSGSASNKNTVSAPPSATLDRVRLALETGSHNLGSNSVTVSPSNSPARMAPSPQTVGDYSETVKAAPAPDRTPPANWSIHVRPRRRFPFDKAAIVLACLVLGVAGVPLVSQLLSDGPDDVQVEISDAALRPADAVHEDGAQMLLSPENKVEKRPSREEGAGRIRRQLEDNLVGRRPEFRNQVRPLGDRLRPKGSPVGNDRAGQDRVGKNPDPVIMLDAFPKHVVHPTVFVRGRVDHHRPVTIRADGVTTQVGQDGRFEMQLNLAFGPNQFVLVASDENGRKAEREIMVFRPHDNPPNRPPHLQPGNDRPRHPGPGMHPPRRRNGPGPGPRPKGGGRR